MSRKGEKLPEAEALARAEKITVTLMRQRGGDERAVMNDKTRAGRAHGHIARIANMTQDNPVAVMVRLGLTDEEMLRVGDFKRTVVWS